MKATALLLLTTALTLFAAQGPDDNYIMTNGQPCPRDGKAKNQAVIALNHAKNRYDEPTVDDVDTDVTLAAMLAPGEDEHRFDATRAARIVGFVVDVKPGSKETCNCEATDPVDRDTHVELALSADAPPNQRVIAEVTPRLRRLMKMKQPPIDWTTFTLQSHGQGGIKGKWVEVTGWLLFDIEHVDVAENTTPGNPSNSRASCWEVHPITDIRVLDHAPENTPSLTSGTLRALQAAHVKQLAHDKSRRDTIEARNKEVRKAYVER
jgi:hypothetical protein